MATLAQWVEGARLRTLPAAIAPVFAGSAIAVHEHAFSSGLAMMCMVIALALQVGVNYANDYSDGIRGTDAERVGPLRLVGSGAADPSQVKMAAFACFGLAAMVGLIVVILTGQWWLIGVGVACIAAAWLYTGGKNPYGYRGLGEVAVYIFFGLVATVGTTYVQTLTAPLAAWFAGNAMGALSCAILVCNNLRDIPTDILAGKRTLETRLGDARSRQLYLGLCVVALVQVGFIAWVMTPWTLLGLGCLVFVVPAMRKIIRGTTGFALVAVLRSTGFAILACGLGLYAGALIGS